MGRRYEQTFFFQRRHQTDGNKHMERCSGSLIIREIQIKPRWVTTSRLSKWLKLKTQETTDIINDVEKGHDSYTVGGKCTLVKPVWKTVWMFLKKLKNNGVPGWLSQLSVQLQLRSWSCGFWVQAPCWALCSQLRTSSLLQILSPSLCLPHSCFVSLKNK